MPIISDAHKIKDYLVAVLILGGFFIAGYCLALGVKYVVHAITGDIQLGAKIGAGVLMISMPVMICIFSLWFTNRRKAAKFLRYGDVALVEIKMAFVFLMVGGATATLITKHDQVRTIVAVCCAATGGLFGFLVRRRFNRLRDEAVLLNQPADD